MKSLGDYLGKSSSDAEDDSGSFDDEADALLAAVKRGDKEAFREHLKSAIVECIAEYEHDEGAQVKSGVTIALGR